MRPQKRCPSYNPSALRAGQSCSILESVNILGRIAKDCIQDDAPGGHRAYGGGLAQEGEQRFAAQPRNWTAA